MIRNMQRRHSFWRRAARVFFIPLFAQLLIVQSMLLPLARAQAAQVAGTDAALGIICSSTLPHPAGEDGGSAERVYDLGCCLLCDRFVLKAPSLVATREPVFAPPVLVLRAFVLPQGRAPPAITATPRQPRAPPFRRMS
jgi:DUF2946 family protein